MAQLAPTLGRAEFNLQRFNPPVTLRMKPRAPSCVGSCAADAPWAQLYGFHKTTQDPDLCEFQHKFFKRDQPGLLHKIKRKVAVEKSDNGKGKIDMDEVAQVVGDLKQRLALFESALVQKEMEKVNAPLSPHCLRLCHSVLSW